MHKAPSEGTVSDKSSEARLWSQTHLFVPGLEPYSLSNLGYVCHVPSELQALICKVGIAAGPPSGARYGDGGGWGGKGRSSIRPHAPSRFRGCGAPSTGRRQLDKAAEVDTSRFG